jgi:hypothetical protein
VLLPTPKKAFKGCEFFCVVAIHHSAPCLRNAQMSNSQLKIAFCEELPICLSL